jgi:hypothetical protein
MPHTTRNFFPPDEPSQYIWAGNHITGLEQIGTGVLGVPAATVTGFRADHTRIGQLYAWRDHAVDLGRDYNRAKERTLWDEGGEEVIIRPVDPASLGNKQINIAPGFYKRLFANIDVVLRNPKCTDEVKRQLYILPPEKTAPELLELSANAKAGFTGGEVILSGGLPKPARFWHIQVDRGDGRGVTYAGTVAGAKFTDHHELPEKPVAWTYTVELRTKDNIPVGKVSVASLTVWKGRADQGPEGGS